MAKVATDSPPRDVPERTHARQPADLDCQQDLSATKGEYGRRKSPLV